MDVILGLAGDDRILGMGGKDLICGGTGKDEVSGGSGSDKIMGGTGRDELAGGAGPDLLRGNHDADNLRGDSGDDRLLGGHDNDSFLEGPGNDKLKGGLDFEGDSVTYPTARHLIVNLRRHRSTSHEGTDQIFGIENVDGSQWGDVIIGNGKANGLSSSGSEPSTKDVIVGGGGDDYVYFQFGTNRDRLLVRTGRGNDSVNIGRALGVIRLGPGDDYYSGYYASSGIRVDGGRGDDYLTGRGGFLVGGFGDDSIYGGFDDDLIKAGPGADYVSGWKGKDLILGQAGDDALYGSMGKDQLDGGSGHDGCADAEVYKRCEIEE